MNQKFLESKKARALLIALINCDLIFLSSVLLKVDIALCSTMITAILTLVSIYIGAQGAIDTVAALKK
jgi:hypothetical protein